MPIGFTTDLFRGDAASARFDVALYSYVQLMLARAFLESPNPYADLRMTLGHYPLGGA